MNDATENHTRKSLVIAGQTLVMPPLSHLAILTALLAAVLWVMDLLGLPVSIPGFIFGCGMMWLVMAGLDLRNPRGWMIVGMWAGLVVTPLIVWILLKAMT